jgi:hypothetical protein
MWIFLALSLTAAEQAQHHLYLANGHFLSGEVEAARREATAAARIDPKAKLLCDGVRVGVRMAELRIDVCDLKRSYPPEPVLREIRLALARGDMDTVRKLDPFHKRRQRAVLLAAVH